MKKIIIISQLLLVSIFHSSATIHTITVSNFQFSPQNIPNVVVGDVIEWVWSNGSHTTTSLAIPATAAPWDEPINSGYNNFQYNVTVTGSYNYECTPHSPGMFGSFTVTSSVPVVLSEFKAINNGSQSLLRWKTSSEQNSDHFSVKRSLNGTDFSEIGRVAAAGNSNVERVYTYTDITVPANSKYAYYLIMIVDKDGKSQNSATRLVANGSASPKLVTSLTPNPISKPGHLMLKFNADHDGSMEAVLWDMQGKSILTASLSAVKGVNNGHIHLGDISPGTYNLVFLLDGIKELHRIIVK